MGRTATLGRLEVARLEEFTSHPHPFRLVQDALRLEEDDDPDDPHFRVELGKSWDGLNFLLTGPQYEFDTPLARAVCGGHRIEFGVYFLAATQVAEISVLLNALTDQELTRRLQTWKPGADIYSAGDWSDASIRAHYLHLFHEFRQFYEDAARRGAAVIQWNQ